MCSFLNWNLGKLAPCVCAIMQLRHNILLMIFAYTRPHELVLLHIICIVGQPIGVATMANKNTPESTSSAFECEHCCGMIFIRTFVHMHIHSNLNVDWYTGNNSVRNSSIAMTSAEHCKKAYHRDLCWIIVWQRLSLESKKLPQDLVLLWALQRAFIHFLRSQEMFSPNLVILEGKEAW